MIYILYIDLCTEWGLSTESAARFKILRLHKDDKSSKLDAWISAKASGHAVYAVSLSVLKREFDCNSHSARCWEYVL